VAIPTWLKVATESDTLTVTGPVTARFGAASGTTYAGTNCAVANCWVTVTITTATNLSLSDASGNLFGVPDPAPGVPKELDVQEATAAIALTVSGKLVTVPALPPPPPPATYTPIAFAPKTSYAFTVSNIPPASSGAPLAFALSIQSGTTVIPLTCTYGTTVVSGTTQSAAFSCIPLPIAAK